MSRIGKKPIEIPAGTEVSVSSSSISVKGPLGALSRPLPAELTIEVKEGKASVLPKTGSGEANALWGSYASHLANMVAGVNKLFEKHLLIEGIGFKADIKGNEIVMSLGFSHPVAVKIPAGIKAVSDKNGIHISGIDTEAVGQFAATIRAHRLPEPYKGKGIRYSDEVIRRKQGKKTV